MALGSVSIVPYTRAEVKQMLKQATYPNGKVVWSGSIAIGSSIAVPEEVDYITILLAGASTETKVARGGTIRWDTNGIKYTLSFSTAGKITNSYSYKYEVGGYFPLTGYHYY